jgi:biopolymer transport protein ExbD
MKHMLEVCLVAFTLAKGITPSAAAQTSAPARENSFQSESQVSSDQHLRKGITVEMPVTSNAVPVPKADNEDSLIVTVTHDGKVYFGIDPISPTELLKKVQDALSNRAEKTLYVKADARTAYANVIKVLDSMHAAGVEGLTLLTAQRDGVEPGTLVPPKGLEMLVVSHRPTARAPSGSR